MRPSALFVLLALTACAATEGPVQRPADATADPAARARAARACSNADWRATGYRHGLAGFPASAMADLQAQCGAAGVRIDRLSYATGRLEGLRRFCTHENGYRLARAGDTRANPCPPELAEAFEAGRRAARGG